MLHLHSRIDNGLPYDGPAMTEARAAGRAFTTANGDVEAHALALSARLYSRVADLQLAFMHGATGADD